MLNCKSGSFVRRWFPLFLPSIDPSIWSNLVDLVSSDYEILFQSPTIQFSCYLTNLTLYSLLSFLRRGCFFLITA
jgi:hypothetical protein